ncbi:MULTISPECIES: hypothetical protein [unclassified Bradyrhizobium]|uniref:hypothetical protein n=2 Tax=Bradyrhizobium TaxID=374 RepID=UPI0028EBA00E|nr:MULTISPECIES: hypothetical protein [unclassified Bradyrhizobium]
MALNWLTESVRLSLFSSQVVKLTGENWKQLTGQDEPEQEQKGSGRHVFASNIIGGQLHLGAIANRCDIILSPVAETDMPEDILSVGNWPNSLEQFQKLTEPFLERLPFPVVRMALAPALLQRFPDRLSAYKTLVSLVKTINQPPEKLHDLLLRVNWPQSSAVVDGLRLNRLTSWSVVQIQVQMLVSDGNRPATYMNEPAYALRLELDHNTDPKHIESFDAARLVPIYRELVNLALQNAQEGEVL